MSELCLHCGQVRGHLPVSMVGVESQKAKSGAVWQFWPKRPGSWLAVLLFGLSVMCSVAGTCSGPQVLGNVLGPGGYSGLS